MNKIDELIKIADIHKNRISRSIDILQTIFPISEIKIKNFSETELLFIELLISRFAKLQDLIGSKIFDSFFDKVGESIDGMTMIDKLNKLEKLRIIENANIWKKIRDARNHISHEYPEDDELTAQYLNQVYELVPELFLILENIKLKLK